MADREPVPPGTPGGDEDVAMLMAQHGALRYADVGTVEHYLGRPAPPVEPTAVVGTPDRPGRR